MQKWVSVIVLCFIAALCSAQTNYCIPGRFGDEVYFDTSQVAADVNVVYGNAVNKYTSQAEDLKMDIYYPKKDSDELSEKPLIFFIHGGGFLGGDKNEGTYKCAQWAQRGYVAVSINYRTGWACAGSVPAALCWCTDGAGIRLAMYEAVQDARAGLRYLTAHAADYGIDTTNVFMAGESAGSIAAMLTTYWSQQETDSFNTNGYMQLGSLDSSGNNLPHGGYVLKGIINSCGAINDTAIINGEALPTIGFHDQNDCVVPYKHGYLINCTGSCYYFSSAMGSSLIHKRVSNLGVCSKLYEVANSNEHCSFPQNELVKKSACFVKGILCNDCSSGYSTKPYDTVSCAAGIITTIGGNNDAPVKVNVYPNPTDGNATLVFNLSASGIVEVKLADVLGRTTIITSAYYPSGRHEIKIGGNQLATGINFYTIRTDKGSVSGKLVKAP